jgi:hypothetical protein
MMGVNKMTGTSWHLEHIHKDDIDPRRHKAKCVYYADGNCRFRIEKCIGSAHCYCYKENPLSESTIENNKNKKETPKKYLKKPIKKNRIEKAAIRKFYKETLGINIKVSKYSHK